MTKMIGVFVATMTMALAGPLEKMKAEVHKKDDKSLPYRWTKVGVGDSGSYTFSARGGRKRERQ
tara:strand:- start:31351 stop:31542 length:192 start_codon:yes stop_codon:yes gene_type:complete